jgi:tetratricopeptide (TPR) repeat protein
MKQKPGHSDDWYLMLGTGRVIGPYSTSAILKMIEDRLVNGDERIKKGVKGSWIAFSQGGEFYEALLELMLEQTRIVEKKRRQNQVSKKNEPKDIVGEETVIQRPTIKPKKEEPALEIIKPIVSAREVALAIQKKKEENIELPVVQNEGQNNQPVTRDEQSPLVLDPYQVPPAGAELIFAAEKQPTQALGKNNKKSAIPMLMIASILLAITWLLLPEESAETQVKLFRLKRPQFGPILAKNNEENKQSANHFITWYQQDSFTNYLKIQEQANVNLERQSNDLGARLFLCLAYRELWPFVSQDNIDYETFTLLVKTTKALDPIGESGIICEISKLMALGRYQEARGVVEYQLASAGRVNNPIFILLKGELLGKSLQYLKAQEFLEAAIRLWPGFVKATYLKGTYALLNGQAELANQSFEDALKLNEQHKASILQLGLLNYEFRNDNSTAWKYLSVGLNNSDKISRQLEVRSLFIAAKILVESNTDLAKKYIQKAYSLHPNDHEIKNLYVQLGGSIGNEQQNMRHQELVYLGDQYMGMGDCLAAQAEYKAAFELDPRNAQAALKAARCLWKLRLYNEGIEWLKKSVGADPKYVDAVALLADYLSQQYYFSEALNVLSRIAPKNARNPEILKSFGLIEFRRNNYKSAIDYFLKSLKVADNNAEILVWLAKSHGAFEEYEQAQNYAIRALEIDPTFDEAIIVYAKNLVAFKGIGAGIGYLNDQIKRFSYTPSLRLALADVYHGMDRYSEAERFYTMVLEYDPRLKAAWLGRGRSYQAQLKMDLAKKDYIEASIVDASDPEPLYLLGLVYLDLTEFAKALKHFEDAIKINSNYPSLYYSAGKAALGLGNLKLALEYAQKEKQKNPRLSDGYRLAAEILDLSQDYQGCAGEYQKVVKLIPKSAQFQINMARCYRLSGALDVAENMLNIAANIESGLPEIYREQGHIFEARSDKLGARSAFEKYLDLAPNARDRKEMQEKLSQLEK